MDGKSRNVIQGYHLDFNSNGLLDTGWFVDEAGKWYCSSQEIEGSMGKMAAAWNYTGGSGHPLGSMYRNEMTPDGYKVDENGVWVQ